MLLRGIVDPQLIAIGSRAEGDNEKWRGMVFGVPWKSILFLNHTAPSRPHLTPVLVAQQDHGFRASTAWVNFPLNDTVFPFTGKSQREVVSMLPLGSGH